MDIIKRFINEEEGITIVEIVLILALVVVIIIAFWDAIGAAITGKQNEIVDHLS